MIEKFNFLKKLEKIENKEKTFSGLITAIDLQTGKSTSFENTEANMQSFITNQGLSTMQLYSDLENIEHDAFSGSNLKAPVEQILGTLITPESIGFIFMEKNKVVGYLSSLRADKLKPYIAHREYDASDQALYIMALAGKIDPYQTLNKLKEQAKAGGYQKITMHGVNARLNNILSRFGFQKKATLKNWSGHQADYMELALD